MKTVNIIKSVAFSCKDEPGSVILFVRYYHTDHEHVHREEKESFKVWRGRKFSESQISLLGQRTRELPTDRNKSPYKIGQDDQFQVCYGKDLSTDKFEDLVYKWISAPRDSVDYNNTEKDENKILSVIDKNGTTITLEEALAKSVDLLTVDRDIVVV